jgi:hypothetical protein
MIGPPGYCGSPCHSITGSVSTSQNRPVSPARLAGPSKTLHRSGLGQCHHPSPSSSRRNSVSTTELWGRQSRNTGAREACIMEDRGLPKASTPSDDIRAHASRPSRSAEMLPNPQTASPGNSVNPSMNRTLWCPSVGECHLSPLRRLAVMKASPNRGDRPEMVDRYRVFSFAKGTASRSRNDEGCAPAGHARRPG